MSVPTKPMNGVQGHQIVLFNRALHPELFTIKGCRVFRDTGYELEAWLMAGAHVLRFCRNGSSVCELLSDAPARTSETASVAAFPALGERDFEYRFDRLGIVYMNSLQSENLPENVYASTHDELLQDARQNKAIVHRWDDDSGPCASILDIQTFPRQAHMQAYHLICSGGLVIRSQCIFEHA